MSRRQTTVPFPNSREPNRYPQSSSIIPTLPSGYGYATSNTQKNVLPRGVSNPSIPSSTAIQNHTRRIAPLPRPRSALRPPPTIPIIGAPPPAASARVQSIMSSRTTLTPAEILSTLSSQPPATPPRRLKRVYTNGQSQTWVDDSPVKEVVQSSTSSSSERVAEATENTPPAPRNAKRACLSFTDQEFDLEVAIASLDSPTKKVFGEGHVKRPVRGGSSREKK